jgi:hypothetical protein
MVLGKSLIFAMKLLLEVASGLLGESSPIAFPGGGDELLGLLVGSLPCLHVTPLCSGSVSLLPFSLQLLQLLFLHQLL